MNTVQIRVKGHLDEQWSAWLYGVSIEYEDEGTSLLRGTVGDQADLFGLFGRIRDLGLTLLAIHYRGGDVENGQPADSR